MSFELIVKKKRAKRVLKNPGATYMHRSTAAISIAAPDDFDQYIQAINQIYNEYINWAFDPVFVEDRKKMPTNHLKDQVHRELYLPLREKYNSIPSTFIQSVRDLALGACRANEFKFKPLKKLNSAILFDARVMQLRGNQLIFSIGNKERFKQDIIIPEYFRKKYEGWKFASGTISFSKEKKSYVVNLTFKKQFKKKVFDKSNDKVVGIDRGIYNIISLSDGHKHFARRIRELKRRRMYQRKMLQAKGTQSAKRRLRLLAGCEKRFSLNENHIISKSLANMRYDVFVFEDLKGIGKQNKGAKMNNWLSNWTFYQLELFTKYKAQALNKLIVSVSPYMTSQTCSKCSNVENNIRDKSHFECSKCGHKEHADINAAKNIKERYLQNMIKFQKKLDKKKICDALQASQHLLFDLHCDSNANKNEQGNVNCPIVDPSLFEENRDTNKPPLQFLPSKMMSKISGG